MTAVVIAHPHWVQRAGGIAEVDRHLQLRGYDAVFVDGSQYLHIERKAEPPGYRPAPTPPPVRLHAPRMHDFGWPRS